MRTEAVSRWYFYEKPLSKLPKESHEIKDLRCVDCAPLQSRRVFFLTKL